MAGSGLGEPVTRLTGQRASLDVRSPSSWPKAVKAKVSRLEICPKPQRGLSAPAGRGLPVRLATRAGRRELAWLFHRHREGEEGEQGRDPRERNDAEEAARHKVGPDLQGERAE